MPSTGTNQAPKITPEVIEGEISSEHYFTAHEGARMAGVADPLHASIEPLPEALKLMTFCVLVMKNGFTVVGKSAVASPSNFSQEIGQKVAREDAVRQIWPLLGYKLVDDLHRIKVLGVNNQEDLGEAMTRLLAHQLGNSEALRSVDAELLLHKLEEKSPDQE